MTARRRKRRFESPRSAGWAVQDAAWRDPVQVASLWEGAGETDPRLLRHRARGAWWDVLRRLGVVLVVSREYEHLLLAISAPGGRPEVSYWPIPHPSGLAVDARRGLLHVASTRSPNQIFDFAPAAGHLSRRDAEDAGLPGRPLVPVRSRFFPGCLYLHDLAMVGGRLHGCAVGQNAVVRIDPSGEYRREWWPRGVERRGRPVVDLNYIQLNSIAAGPSLRQSYFTASSDAIGSRRPGHRDYAVDRRGVLFSGATREPVARGLTRPHSARLHRGGVWVDDSGYGRLVRVEGGRVVEVARLPGWTRGLAFSGGVAFVGTSRVLPRFLRYAPGLDPSRSVCGVHAVDTRSGRVLGSLIWPDGNQIFGIEPLSRRFTTGFPLPVGRARALARIRKLFYSFSHEVRE